MNLTLAHSWWTFAARGALAALFGFLTMAMPELTLATFVLLFGWYAFVEGGLNLLGAVRASLHRDPWWPLLLEGGISLGAGLLLFFQPDIGWRALLSLLAFWALTKGVFELLAAARLREKIAGEWLLAAGGVISLALGAVLELVPALDPLKVVFWLGAYTVCFGSVLIALGMRLRGYVDDHEHTTLGPPLTNP
ncbi:MAG: HdeD family acid-resistance protein [Polyangiaceae bacterium]|jgi:uncharacterized membrane protein HdeD (DUF308 family)|nr:HdeD family acid-resistance protein [Polyangiaceae bacterium]